MLGRLAEEVTQVRTLYLPLNASCTLQLRSVSTSHNAHSKTDFSDNKHFLFLPLVLLATEVESLVPLCLRRQALKPGAATQLDAATLETVAGDAPSAVLPRAAVAGVPLADVMVAVKLQPSKSAARK